MPVHSRMRLGVRADPRSGRERVGAPRLGGPHRIESEALRLLRERHRERVGLRAPVAELESEFHACVLGQRRVNGPPCGRLHAMAQHFEGVIGRDWRDSTPWWPPEPGRRPARPTCC